MSTNVKLRMQKAAHLLMAGHSSRKVAEMLKARPETLSRWKKDPRFIEAYEQLRSEVCEDMRVKLWRMAVGAFDHVCEGVRSEFDTKDGYENALRFFKMIKIEQIFAPQTPVKVENPPQ